MTKDYKKTLKIVEELEEYLDCTEDEVTELYSLLIRAITGYPDYMSNELYDALLQDIKTQLEWFKNNTTIIKTEMVHSSTYTRKELDYHYGNPDNMLYEEEDE